MRGQHVSKSTPITDLLAKAAPLGGPHALQAPLRGLVTQLHSVMQGLVEQDAAQAQPAFGCVRGQAISPQPCHDALAHCQVSATSGAPKRTCSLTADLAARMTVRRPRRLVQASWWRSSSRWHGHTLARRWMAGRHARLANRSRSALFMCQSRTDPTHALRTSAAW
jgi:hypothetical protein